MSVKGIVIDEEKLAGLVKERLIKRFGFPVGRESALVGVDIVVEVVMGVLAEEYGVPEITEVS